MVVLSFLAMLSSMYPQEIHAEGLIANELLNWTPQNQRFYIQTSITMAGVIASQSDKEKARCIDGWHQRQSEQQYASVVDAFRQYPAYHPQGVILAFVQKACGTMN